MKKKLLFMMLLLCAVVQGAWADKWDGKTTKRPAEYGVAPNFVFFIRTAAELAYIQQNWEVRDCYGLPGNDGYCYKYTYYLEDDFDMTAVNWKPFDHAFEGKFYGKGHTIKIKNDSYTSSNCQGLFAEIAKNGLVEDVRLEVDFNFNNSRKVGGITGDNYGTIKDCWVTGTITTNHYNTSNDADLGGIAGLNESDGKIQYCCFDGTVKNTAKNTGVGGLVGRNKGTLEHCTFYGDVVSGRTQANIFIGVQKKAYSECYTNYDGAEISAIGTEYDVYHDAIMYRFKYFYNSTMYISSEEQWKEFASYVNHGFTFKDKTVALDKDITVTVVNEKIWNTTSSAPKVDDPTLRPFVGSGYLSSFQGTFDGGGHTITFNVDKRNYKDLRVKGLAPFRWVCGATIKNLIVAGTFNNREGDYTSALVGNAFGSGNKIEDCVVKALVAGNSAAGFVGNLLNGDIALDGCVMTGVLHSVNRSAFIGWGNCDKQDVTNCLYIRQSVQDNNNLDLVKNDATLAMSNTYKTTPAGSKGTPADMYVTEPTELGNVKKEYSVCSHLTAYEHGVKYDGKWYKAATEFTGEGTAENPYIISSAEEWERFAYRVNQGNNYFDQHLKLTSDISVTTVAGTAENTFRGTFDGGGKTLTVNYTGGDYTAPFSYTTDATIKNLNVDGTINATGKYAGGIVGSAYGKLTLDGCRSSVAINSSVSGEAWHGGLVGYGANYNELSIDRCVFDGSFSTTNGSTHCGGLIGFKEGGTEYSTYTISNSFVKPRSVAAGMVSGSFIGSLREDGKYPITNSYFVKIGDLPANQGIQAYSSVPAGNITRQMTFIGETYFVPCTVEANQLYQYTGSSITVDNPTVKAYDGTTLTANTDYTYTTDPAEVKSEGTYNLVVSGKAGSNYTGSVTIPFMVAGDASDDKNLTTGEYTVHNTLIIDDRIPIKGDVVINILENVVLYASKGIELPEGSSLTINGPGALVIQSCDENNAGIGGATMGTLIINSGQVDILGGKGAPGIGPNSGTSSGRLELSWRNAEDYIKCSNYAVAEITFDKKFVLDGKSDEANASNIHGETIVPYGKTGTETNPILIDDIDDWNFFARTINEGNDYNGKYVKLAVDLNDVTKMAGAWSDNVRYRRPFCGTFDGGGHTITVDIQNSLQTGVALFNYVKNATIKNLNMNGKITGHRHSASLVGYADGTTSETGNTIENCTSAVTVTGPRSVSGNNFMGGLVGNALNSKITIKGCVYSGLMLNAAQGRGAILGWGEADGERTIDNCLYLMSEEQSTTNLDLARQQGGNLTVNANCYKTTDAGTYGTQVDIEAAAGEISRVVTAADSKTYYIPCTVSGEVDYYKWTGNAIAITVPTVTARDQAVLTLETDFTCTTDPGTVNAEGYYTLTVSGKGNYTGSKSFVFAVGKDDPVTSETTELKDGTYKVYHYLLNNNRINISGNVTLILAEGATLNAPKGIELSSGNTLTIEGPGALVVNDCDAGKSGIGAASMGKLTVNGGQLDIQGAEGAGGIGSDKDKTASGILTILTSAVSDYVKCSSYKVSSNDFTLAKRFVIADEQTIATTENIGGKKIVPAMLLADQGSTNNAELENYDGKQITAVLNDRTFYLDGKWNTISLPFDYYIDELKGVEARTLTAASIEGTTLNLTFGDPVTELKAGVPYIIKFNAESYEANGNHHLVNPVFEGVTINNTTANCEFGSGDTRVRFMGTYDAVNFTAEDISTWLMDGDHNLYNPANGAGIGACRAYFMIGDGKSGARVTDFKIKFGDTGSPVAFTITDADTYTETEDVETLSATYNKALGAERTGKYQPWLIPFDYTITAADVEKFTFWRLNMIANSPDPNVEAGTEVWVYLSRMKAGDVLHANMPYVYKPLTDMENYEFTTENAVLKGKNTGVLIKMETANDIYSFYATYEPTLATAQDPFYYVNYKGHLSVGNNGTVTVGAFRWILRVESKSGSTPANSRSIVFIDGDGTTGISLTPDPSPIGEGSGYWFTLDGRRLQGKPSRAGVYIYNGKKFVIK